MAEQDYRQARVLARDQVVDGSDIGDDFFVAVTLGEPPPRRIGRRCPDTTPVMPSPVV